MTRSEGMFVAGGFMILLILALVLIVGLTQTYYIIHLLTFFLGMFFGLWIKEFNEVRKYVNTEYEKKRKGKNA